MPYWIVSQSVLPLEFAHCQNRGAPLAPLNGCDGLCADQEYRYRYEDRSTKAGAGGGVGVGAARSAAAGFGGFGFGVGGFGGAAGAAVGSRPARGAGVLLGPERAVRGLGDVVEGRASLGGPLGSSPGLGTGLGFLSRQALSRRRSVSGGDAMGSSSPGSVVPGAWDDGDAETPRVAVVQCGYSKPDRRAATTLRLRLRGRMAPSAPGSGPGSPAVPAPSDAKSWSTPFALDLLDTTETELSRASTPHRGSDAAALGASRRFAATATDDGASLDGPQTFVFGVYSARAEAPFGRTKVVVVVDRYLLINCLGGGGGGGGGAGGAGAGAALGTGQSTGSRGAGKGPALEVRQEGYDQELLTVRPGESSALCWRAPRHGGGEPKGRGCVQIRLAQPGWAWSGRVSLGSSKSEVTLRLRNERDQSVFFLLVQVVMHGPRVCVIFRGGGHLAPYRIENHTLDTLQVTQNFDWRRGAVSQAPPGLQLLPYHVAAYAWDEPLQPAELRLQVLTSGGGGGGRAGPSGFRNGGGFPGLATSSGGLGAAAGPLGASSAGASAEYSAFNRRAWREVGVFSYERLRTWAGLAGADARVRAGEGVGSGSSSGPTEASLGCFVVRVVTSGGQRVLQIHDRRNLPSLSSLRRPSAGHAPFAWTGAGGSAAWPGPGAGPWAGAGAGMWTPPSPVGWGGTETPPLRIGLRVESLGGATPHSRNKLIITHFSIPTSVSSSPLTTLLPLPLPLSPSPPRSVARGPPAPGAAVSLPARREPRPLLRPRRLSRRPRTAPVRLRAPPPARLAAVVHALSIHPLPSAPGPWTGWAAVARSSG